MSKSSVWQSVATFFQKKKTRVITGTLFFLAGIALIFYPWVDRHFQKQQQLQLLTQWELNQNEQGERNIPEQVSISTTTETTEADLEVQVEQPKQEHKVKELGEMIGVITIDKIELKEPIVVGSTEATLDLGIGTVIPERYPGELGNFVLAGHRGWSRGYQFNRLDELAEGDEITITTGEQTYTYQVTSSFIVTPDDLSVLDEDETSSEITLITCEPMFRSTHRLIVKAELKEESS